jgi:hypothetical protein
VGNSTASIDPDDLVEETDDARDAARAKVQAIRSATIGR